MPPATCHGLVRALLAPAHAFVLAGETWFFQCWYRDNNPGPTSHFTDASERDVLLEAPSGCGSSPTIWQSG
ncbi:MAG: hypothetical protein GY711_30745 [bacterium]|nr:hypothetical protein [bacterium]